LDNFGLDSTISLQFPLNYHEESMSQIVQPVKKLRDDLLYKDEAFAIIGAAINVHKELGPGFLEAVYQEALEIELCALSIPFEAQKNLPIYYRDRLLQKCYIADLVCFDKIIVELKAIEHLTSKDESQILNYLKATKLRLGLLINFGSSPLLEHKRRVN
jgi:GxxExxY protein